MAFPGWESIEAAAGWHRGFEIAGFVALGLLLLFEVAAYVYGNRKDSLVTAADLNASRLRQQQESAADQHRDAEVADAKRRAHAAEISAKLARQPRRLTEAQQAAPKNTLSKYPGLSIG